MKQLKKFSILFICLLLIATGVLSLILFYKFSISVAITPISDGCTIYKDHCTHVSFQTRDKITLDAILVDNPTAEDIAVYVHGFGMNNGDSYAHGKIETLLALNFKVFALNLRNHGYSQKTSTTAGKTEALDVLAAINYIETYLNVKPTLMWCTSMGCNATIYGIIEKEFEKPDFSIPDLIIESPMEEVYASVRSFVPTMSSLPWIPFGFFALKFAEIYAGISFGNQHIAEDIKIIQSKYCYVFFGNHDEFFSQNNAELITKNGHCKLIIIDQATHFDTWPLGKDQFIHAIQAHSL